MATPLLDISDLSVQLTVPAGELHAVRNLSLTLNRGESLGIVGESGSGKSMTAMALMRLLPKVASLQCQHMRYRGTELTTIPDREFAADYLGTRIAMIFQEPMTSLNPVYTIGRQLTEASVTWGRMTHSQAYDRALALLDRVGIPHPKSRMTQYPHQLSGGQRQRVMIAMALMQDPELLIADEPTTALDVTIQAQIMALLDELRHERNMGMILITHDLAVVSENVDRISVMYGGEVVEEGDAQRVLATPKHPYTRALLRAIPSMDARPSRLGAIPGVVPSLMDQPAGCVFAPRCTFATEQCHTERPPMRGEPLHQRRCILTDADLAQAPGVHDRPDLPPRRIDTDTVLSARNVTRVFRSRKRLFGPPFETRAVDDVNLEMQRGETLALVGESGSGKTTLSRILLGLDQPTSGTIHIDGKPVESLGRMERAGLVQPIFQDPYSSLNPRRTLLQIIARPLALQNRGTEQERMDLARRQLELVRLPGHLEHSYPSQLSGGQRQRVAIARALITQPEILICDEPTSALDVSVQAQILNLLIDLQADLGLTCLLITHDMAVVRQLATRIMVMLDGRIVEQGDADDVLTRPTSDYTQALLASAPQFKPQSEPATGDVQ